MKITEKKIEELAHLARLEFDQDKAQVIKADLERILEFCEKLNEVDTEGVEPLVYLSDRVNNLRTDIPVEPLKRETALKNAPNSDSDFFKVPKVIKR